MTLQWGKGGLRALLRFTLLASKLGFGVYLVNAGRADIFAQYAVLQSISAVYTFAGGLDLYTYFILQLPTSDCRQRSSLIVTQYAAHLVMDIILALVLIGSDCFGLSKGNSLLVAGVCLAEHLSQELGRTLVALGLGTEAQWLFLLRSTAWMAPLCGLEALTHNNSVDSLLGWWLGGSLSACLLGAAIVRRTIHTGWKLTGFSFQHLQHAARLSPAILVGSLLSRLYQLFLRKRIEACYGATTLADFVMMYNIAQGIASLFDAFFYVEWFRRFVVRASQKPERLTAVLREGVLAACLIYGAGVAAALVLQPAVEFVRPGLVIYRTGLCMFLVVWSALCLCVASLCTTSLLILGRKRMVVLAPCLAVLGSVLALELALRSKSMASYAGVVGDLCFNGILVSVVLWGLWKAMKTLRASCPSCAVSALGIEEL